MAAGKIDWDDLIKRQEKAFAAAGGGAITPEKEQAVLRERARLLAQRPEKDRESAESIDALVFVLSGESYAVESAYVLETLPLGDFTPLFSTPPFVLGVTNLRGRIVSIIDLRRFFDLPAIGLSDLNRVVLVSNGSMEFGILADAIVGMRSLDKASLKPTPETFTGIREEFVAGVSAERLALLDLGKIMTDARIVVHEEVA
ncbi:scaffold protein CheW associated with MCPs of class 40H [Citrifermentans bemidjiense Bem]|uniref:Scaffold protein CheW associated with MCPs of class 40H n=1 Tax=Citrifermentans bemidjiense (strain ATCC BAA-1014 / DSM 16622 / JCM 12645 / Bem) TaxID=404380 RepID=B5ECK7_CITBB|nr:chemotaxis protein CheW [Citrifermentans bemidjiense]ACH39042.1 scaffold protein CheW associated with MCPs of class 40H [Citrifermentans bemidjiense Bem]